MRLDARSALQTIPHPLRHTRRAHLLITHNGRQHAVLLLLVQRVAPQIDALGRHSELAGHFCFGVAEFCDEFLFVHAVDIKVG